MKLLPSEFFSFGHGPSLWTQLFWEDVVLLLGLWSLENDGWILRSLLSNWSSSRLLLLLVSFRLWLLLLFCVLCILCSVEWFVWSTQRFRLNRWPNHSFLNLLLLNPLLLSLSLQNALSQLLLLFKLFLLLLRQSFLVSSWERLSRQVARQAHDLILSTLGVFFLLHRCCLFNLLYFLLTLFLHPLRILLLLLPKLLLLNLFPHLPWHLVNVWLRLLHHRRLVPRLDRPLLSKQGLLDSSLPCCLFLFLLLQSLLVKFSLRRFDRFLDNLFLGGRLGCRRGLVFTWVGFSLTSLLTAFYLFEFLLDWDAFFLGKFGDLGAILLLFALLFLFCFFALQL